MAVTMTRVEHSSASLMYSSERKALKSDSCRKIPISLIDPATGVLSANACFRQSCLLRELQLNRCLGFRAYAS